ncbi:dynamin-related protein 4C-like [Populus alba x Populus x berolinensis]|nr:dynamin-related protein 4C-like [Populus alba x Populus x berolinensis]
MSQKVDKNGERTIAVVTKVDKTPEGLLEKVTRNDVNIGLGYVCVRNRIGNESYEDARKEEAALFATHQLLSKIEKSTVGIQVLANKLVRIQANIIAKCLPDIVRKINEKLKASISELNKIPRRLLSVAEVMAAFMGIIGSSKESLRKILVRGVEGMSKLPTEFVEKVWTYIEEVVISVLNHHSESYHQIQLSTRRAGHNLVAKMKEQSINWVTEIVQMEKETDYTCNPEYMKEWNKLMAQQDTVIDSIKRYGSSKVVIDGSREMRLIAYWEIVLMRLVDNMALHLQLSIRNLVNKEMEKEIVNELLGTGGGVAIEKLFVESPTVASKRENLNTSINLLRESQEVMANIMDEIGVIRAYQKMLLLMLFLFLLLSKYVLLRCLLSSMCFRFAN